MHVGAVLPDSTVIIIALGNLGKTSCPPIALISTHPYFLEDICNSHNLIMCLENILKLVHKPLSDIQVYFQRDPFQGPSNLAEDKRRDL